MRPASDVLSRLNWDASCIDANDVVIGYLDRFEGIKEMGFYEWMEVTGRIVGGNTKDMKGKADVTAEDFIPQHRIQYFKVKTTGVIIWDKRSGVDAVFGTGKPQMRMHGATTASISEMECGATL